MEVFVKVRYARPTVYSYRGDNLILRLHLSPSILQRYAIIFNTICIQASTVINSRAHTRSQALVRLS